MGKEWIKLRETGQLYLEKVLVSFDIPILFVCADYENRKYLCLNIDEESGKSVIVATNNEHLIQMLTNKITMEYVFRNPIDDKVIVAEYDFENERVVSCIEKAKDVSADMLPKKNEYFEITDAIIEEYIIYLKKQCIKIVSESFTDKISYTINKNKFSSHYDVRNLVTRTCGKVIIDETKNKCAYQIKEVNIA